MNLGKLKIKVCNDISKLFKKDIDIVLKNTDKSLFCEPFYLTPEELLYLYFYIKRNYSASLGKQKIMEGSFQTIDKICHLMY